MMVNLAKSVVIETMPAAMPYAGGPVKGKYRSGEGQTLLYERNEKWNGTSRLVIAYHGHGATSDQFGSNSGPAAGCQALARTGRYIVLSIDGGPSLNQWGNDGAIRAINDALGWGHTLGAKTGTWAMHGWSMGGLTCLNYMRREVFTPVIGGWLWVPAIDLQWCASTTGYVPDHGVAVPNNATWTAECNSNTPPYGMYRPTGVVGTTVTVPAPGGAGVSVVPAAASDPFMGINDFPDCFDGPQTCYTNMTGTPFTYTGKNSTALTGCVMTSGPAVSLPATTASIWVPPSATYAMKGYDPYNQYVDYQHLNAQVCLALASDDTTLPPAIADAWLAKVNNPNIFQHPKGKVTGGHTMLFGNFTDAEIVAFYDSLPWGDNQVGSGGGFPTR